MQIRIPKMSQPLVVSIPHRLGREEASRRLKGGLTRAAASVQVLKVDEERWEGDRMIFRVRALGQAASGHLDVAGDHVRLEVTLPWLLQRFAQAAQVAIKNRGNLLLTKRGCRPPVDLPLPQNCEHPSPSFHSTFRLLLS